MKSIRNILFPAVLTLGAGLHATSSTGAPVMTYFAPDLPAAQANLIAITQGAVRGKNFDEKLTKTAWQTKPSWYIVAEKDLMIDPAAERETAKKTKATTVSLPTSHVPMLSKPKEVADVIVAAANNIK
jgi:pimeloyl-ACP methyl ester carboxylesterase